jgi:hypothetical protein
MTSGYKLTAQDNVVINTETGATIPEGNWLWDQYQEWLAAGNTPDPVDRPDPSMAIIEQIAALESQVTDRRIREAVLGVDGGWLKEQDAKISALREHLE